MRAVKVSCDVETEPKHRAVLLQVMQCVLMNQKIKSEYDTQDDFDWIFLCKLVFFFSRGSVFSVTV